MFVYVLRIQETKLKINIGLVTQTEIWTTDIFVKNINKAENVKNSYIGTDLCYKCINKGHQTIAYEY